MTCNTTGCTLAAYARVPRKCSSALGWPGDKDCSNCQSVASGFWETLTATSPFCSRFDFLTQVWRCAHRADILDLTFSSTPAVNGSSANIEARRSWTGAVHRPPLQITTLPPATSKQRCHAKLV